MPRESRHLLEHAIIYAYATGISTTMLNLGDDVDVKIRFIGYNNTAVSKMLQLYYSVSGAFPQSAYCALFFKLKNNCGKPNPA